MQAIDTALVMKVLQQRVRDVPNGPATPLWTARPETASRLRGRIESVLDWARARGHREGENPARWRGHLDKLLPPRSKVRRVRHHAAMPYDALPCFVAALRTQEGIAARALELTILTVARTSETIGAAWPGINAADATWTVPAERMKAHKEHRVPLCGRAVVILDGMRPYRDADAGFVFPGAGKGMPLSNMSMAAVLKRMGHDAVTVHGFRSTFRDWAAECTNFPNHVVEMALAHAIGDEVEAAYRRGDLFEKRRELMKAWETHCAAELSTGRASKVRQNPQQRKVRQKTAA